MLLALEGSRGTVGLRGRVREPALFRDALAAALGVLASDLRYRGRDRTAYLAYLMKQGKRATAQIWEAQKAFLDASLQSEEQKDTVLDPVLTVDPDQVSLEVFSRDESAYARLAFDNSLFDGREAAHGSTFLDVPPELVNKVDRLRTYVPLSLEAHVALPARGGPSPAQRGGAARLAARLPPGAVGRHAARRTRARWRPSTCTTCSSRCAPGRRRRPRARCASSSSRALRRAWWWSRGSWCWSATASVYTGTAPAVVRTFGRQRLAALARLLPHAQSVRVQLLGPGLPVFWVVDMGPATLTLALTGLDGERLVQRRGLRRADAARRAGGARGEAAPAAALGGPALLRDAGGGRGSSQGRGARGAAARVPARTRPLRHRPGRRTARAS